MEGESLAAARVLELQIRGMKGEALGAAVIGQGSAVNGPIVDFFPADGRSPLAKMNAHLMGSSGLEPALNECEITERFQNAHVRDRSFSFARRARAAATRVAAVGNKVGFDASRLCAAADDGEIASADAVGAELPAQVSLRGRCAGKDDEAAGIPIEAVHSSHRQAAAPRIGGKKVGQEFREGWRKKPLATPAELRGLVSMPHRCQPGRLVHDDDVCIHMAHDRLRPPIFGPGSLFLPWSGVRGRARFRRRGRVLRVEIVNDDSLPRLEALLGVATQ